MSHEHHHAPSAAHHPASIASIQASVDALGAQVAYLVERQKKTEELLAEMTPILRLAMGVATNRLADLEQKGYFAFGREALRVGERVVEGFTPDDVRRFGDAVVSILETVRAMTQPEVLAIAGEAARALEKADDTEPMGLLGMVRATRDDDVQRGMAVLMELMRHVGRGATVMAEKRASSPQAKKKERLAAITGSKRPKRALGVERTLPAQVAVAPRKAAASCAVPSEGPAPVAAVIDGVGFGADGHLADPAQWSTGLAENLAAAQGVPLDEERWKVVRFAREDFEATKVSPNIRRITQALGVATKDLYTLFPKAPARTIAKIAGIPKPAGCI